MCGEKKNARLIFVNLTGSPPHVRGKVAGAINAKEEAGITPACAGKSDFDNVRRGQTQDHPRMCGEKMMVHLCLLLRLGSPPHVRGKETGSVQRRERRRITPACAGKSLSGWSALPDLQDHPRMCGEKQISE